jgi:cell division protein FtsX
MSVAMLISYIDPAVCAGSGLQDLETCTQVATERLIGVAVLFAFGSITLVGGAIRSRLTNKRELLASQK